MINPVKRLHAVAGAFVALMVAGIGAAFAAKPVDWQLWHQPAASEIMVYIEWFSAYTLWFIIPITLFVLFLLIYVLVRYRASANPTASKTSHNSLIEAAWTVIPIIILVFIAVPSFDLLEKEMVPEEQPEMTIKVTGYQWYWGYEYQDDSEISFDSIMLREASEREEFGKTDLEEYPRLLAVDNDIVVPVDTMVRFTVTAADVLHSFTVPAFGFKMDAVPGRLNETWMKANREGIFYGQCSELCGKDHAFMPIAIRVVSKEQYESWRTAAIEDLEGANKALMASIEADKNTKLASNEQAAE